MSSRNEIDTIKGISMYFNWGLALLKRILPTDISPGELKEAKKADSITNLLILEFLDATTCFISKQYMKDPQLKYISSSKERWFSCVLLGDNWRSVLKGIFNKELDKKLNKANCIIFDFATTDGEGIDITFKEKMIVNKENYYAFKNQIIDKFGIKVIEYKPENYDPNEGNLILDKKDLTITCDSTNVQPLWGEGKPPFWLYNALDWDTVDKIKIKIIDEESNNPFTLKSIINKIVVYPDCPTEWRDFNSGNKSLEIIENQIEKRICDFFIYLTISGEGENWYPLLNSAIEKTIEQWRPFLNYINKISPDRSNSYKKTLLKRYFALPESLTIRAESEYKNLIDYLFILNKEEMVQDKNFILPATDESLNFILKRIGDPDYIRSSVSLIKEMIQSLKDKLKNKIQGGEFVLMFIDYLEKNISFVEELNTFYEELIQQIDEWFLGFLQDVRQEKFEKITQYIVSLLLKEKDNNLRQKIVAFLMYRNKIFDVIPDIYESGDIDDRYAAVNLILYLKENKCDVPDAILNWAESEKVRAEYMLGNEMCNSIKSRLDEIEKSLENIIKKKP